MTAVALFAALVGGWSLFTRHTATVLRMVVLPGPTEGGQPDTRGSDPVKPNLIAVLALAATLCAFTLCGDANAGRQLTRPQAVRELRKSESVLRFFTNPRHRWLVARRHTKCWGVPWGRDCRIARSLVRHHRARARHHRSWLVAHDPVVLSLNRGLAGTPMRGLGRVLELEGRRAGVNPYFIAAVAGTESSFGAAACGTYGHNAWGLGNCGSAWTVPPFFTWREAIRYFARFVADRWPSASTPYDMFGYAACDSCWAAKTVSHFGRFHERAYVRYQRPEVLLP